jgi:ATP/maltotriose-dependent transcriptional regulator MalT
MENERLELSNLSNGEYELLFRTANNLGGKSPVKQLNLLVLTPWYKGTSAIVLLGMLIMVILTVSYFLHKRKVLKEQKLMQLKFDFEQGEFIKKKTIESEKEIIKLKTESLENEIKLKSKQLANTAMALVKKNEALQEIKKELLLHKNNFDNSYTFKRLQKRIDNTIGHEDEWEIFEYNFNQVHEEFFNQLKSKFPHLTHKDLKICAYIKMNLSNKEIAPLMNISTRGVETHRYRLKRKLQLENDISLGDYLLNFQ